MKLLKISYNRISSLRPWLAAKVQSKVVSGWSMGSCFPLCYTIFALPYRIYFEHIFKIICSGVRLDRVSTVLPH